jgi:hypothetical protein
VFDLPGVRLTDLSRMLACDRTIARPLQISFL